jgi:uncharacterized protein (DUF983 family)
MKFFRGTKLYSIFTEKCPVCHEGKMYKEDNPYKINRIFDMYERCSVCSTKYKIEPSFFFGAMYVSYALGVAFGVAAFIIAYFFLGMSKLNTFFVIVCTLIIFVPLIARWSRNIWINFFFQYREL